MSSASSSNHHLVTNQRNVTRSQVNNNNGSSSSSAQQHKPPKSSPSPSSSQHNHESTKKLPTSHHHIKNHPRNPDYQHSQQNQPNTKYSSELTPGDHERSMSAALQRLSHHHTIQQTNSLLKQRTYSTSAISSVHTNFQNNQTSLSKYSKRIEDLSKLVTAQLHKQAAHNSPNPLQRQHNDAQHQLLEHVDRDNEETTIKEEAIENDLDGLKETDLEALGSLAQSLPVELSFLIRQQAFCMARVNYLDRQIKELQEASRQHQVEVASAGQVSSNSNALNHRLQGHHYQQLNQHQQNHQQILTAQGQAITATTSKNGNFILSDDSGGEYSRATISDDDELSSLLDQIAKSVRPEQQKVVGVSGSLIGNSNISQSMPPSHQFDLQMSSNQLYQRPSAMANYNTYQNHQQPHQQYAIINSNQIHTQHQQQQAVPIFVMGSPIIPLAHHPSSISSNILPGVHFQPEPRYNQYYEDFYCNGPNVNSAATASTTASVPSAITMVMPTRQQQFAHQHPQQQFHYQNAKSSQHQQHFDNNITAIEQLVSQKEKRQIMSQLKTADNWLKLRSSNLAPNVGGNLNESSFNSGSNNKCNSDTVVSGGGDCVRVTAPSSSSSIVAATARRDLINMAQQTSSDKISNNNINMASVAEQTNLTATRVVADEKR